jgi:plastocyanin
MNSACHEGAGGGIKLAFPFIVGQDKRAASALGETTMNSRTNLTLGGLLLVALTVAGCNGNMSSPAGPSGIPTAADLTITITGLNGSLSFSPNPASVKVGQTVAWRNADSISHTATADAGGFNTGTIAPGTTTAAVAMPAAGSFSYHCSIHPSMTGTLNVTP